MPSDSTHDIEAIRRHVRHAGRARHARAKHARGQHALRGQHGVRWRAWAGLLQYCSTTYYTLTLNTPAANTHCKTALSAADGLGSHIYYIL